MAAGRALGVGAGVPDRVAPAAGAAVAQPNYHAQPRGMPAGMPPIMGMMGMPAGADVAGLLHLMPEGTGRVTAEPDDVNPATGLPTVGGAGTPDIAGNPYGLNLAHRHDDWDRHDQWPMGSSFDDHARWRDNASASDIGGGYDPWRQ